MLQRIEQLIEANQTFAFETTLSTRSYVSLIEECKEKGYATHLIFLWLNSPELAMERVQTRVAKGGHNIPEDVIRRRYAKGLENFVNLFMPLCDEWMVADNSQSTPTVIAKGKSTYVELRIQQEAWNQILKYGSK